MQKKFISTLLKDLKWLMIFFFFFAACHDFVNSQAGRSKMSCRSARLLKMQNTPGSGFCFIHRLVFTSQTLLGEFLIMHKT